MAEKPQDIVSPKVPDYEVANFRKKLLDLYPEQPKRADSFKQMLELVATGVSPDVAAPACGIHDEWEEIDWMREAVDAQWARFKARVLMHIGNHLVGKAEAPQPTIATLFLKSHCGFNEKSAEGWHQVIKILPIVSEPAGITHSPDKNYAEFYMERRRRAEKEAADAVDEQYPERIGP